MIDIISSDEKGMGLYDTQTERAANILGVQLGAVDYWPEGGIDLKYFLTEPIAFQDTAFRAYLVQKLAEWGINVANLAADLDALFENYLIRLSAPETSTALIAR